ncbi:hypothetical protein V8D89_008580 [Ganoderma adspersum]
MDLISTGDTGTIASPPGLSNSFPLDSTFGALLLGTYFSLILFGGIVHQTLRYYQTYPDDLLWSKTLRFMYLLLLLRASHWILEHIVAGTPSSYPSAVFKMGIAVSTVFNFLFVEHTSCSHFILVGRQYRGWAIFVVTYQISRYTQLGLTEAFKGHPTPLRIRMTTPPATSTGVIPHPWMITTAVGIAIVADSILTVIITLSLHRSRTGIKCTDSLMDILILYTITTGLLTSAFMLGLFVLAILRPNDMIYVGLSLIVSKLYANTLLAALNTRQSLRDAAFNPSGVEIFGSTGGDGPSAEQRSVQICATREIHMGTQYLSSCPTCGLGVEGDSPSNSRRGNISETSNAPVALPFGSGSPFAMRLRSANSPLPLTPNISTPEGLLNAASRREFRISSESVGAMEQRQCGWDSVRLVTTKESATYIMSFGRATAYTPVSRELSEAIETPTGRYCVEDQETVRMAVSIQSAATANAAATATIHYRRSILNVFLIWHSPVYCGSFQIRKINEASSKESTDAQPSDLAKTLFPSTSMLGDDVLEKDVGMRTDRILRAGGWPVSGSDGLCPVLLARMVQTPMTSGASPRRVPSRCIFG